jgi:predicted nuclease of predicted toxin-antitoxin system
MTAIRLYLDEDVHPFIADALRRRGWQATTTVEVGRRGATDADQLAFATEQGFAILTYNVGHFARLHYELLARGETHAGIVLATQADPRRNLRALLSLVSSLTAESIHGNLVYLNNWA